MREEKELLNIFKNENVYKLDDEIRIENSLELNNLDDFIRFVENNNINSIFYYYSYIDEYCLSIDSEDISEFRIDKEVLTVLQEDFDKYNEEVSKLDFSKPISLNIYCIYQGMILFIEENDSWYIDKGFYTPEVACKRIIENHLEEIELEKKNMIDRVNKGRKELRERLLNNEEFHKCTNHNLRMIYSHKIIRNNEIDKSLFFHNDGRLIDLPVGYFLEDVWKEYKNSIKK